MSGSQTFVDLYYGVNNWGRMNREARFDCESSGSRMTYLVADWGFGHLQAVIDHDEDLLKREIVRWAEPDQLIVEIHCDSHINIPWLLKIVKSIHLIPCMVTPPPDARPLYHHTRPADTDSLLHRRNHEQSMLFGQQFWESVTFTVLCLSNPPPSSSDMG